jgi:hypothetical protein
MRPTDEVHAGEELRDVGEQLDAMLGGGSSAPLGDAEREICAAGVGDSEELVLGRRTRRRRGRPLSSPRLR